MWRRTKGISQCLWKPTAHFLCIINRNPHSLLRKGVKKTKKNPNIIKSKHPKLPWSSLILCSNTHTNLTSYAQTNASINTHTHTCAHTHTFKSPVVHVRPLSDGAGTPQRGISATAGIALGSGTRWLRALCLRLAARGPCRQELSLKATGEGLSNRREMMSLVYTPYRGAAFKGWGGSHPDKYILTLISLLQPQIQSLIFSSCTKLYSRWTLRAALKKKSTQLHYFA